MQTVVEKLLTKLIDKSVKEIMENADISIFRVKSLDFIEEGGMVVANFQMKRLEDELRAPIFTPRFLTVRHRELFFKESGHLSASKEYQAALFLLTSQPDLIDRMIPYFRKESFDYQAMFEEIDFSNEHQLIAKLIVHIYLGEPEPSLSKVAALLDYESFHAFIQANIIRECGMKEQ